MGRTTNASCNTGCNEGCTPSTQRELSNMDVSGDPTGYSALAMAPHNIKKGLTTTSSLTIPMSVAVLLSFSCFYTLLPIHSTHSLTSLKARLCPQRTSSVLEATAGGGKGRAKTALAPLSPEHLFPFFLPSFPTAPFWLQTWDSSASLGDQAGQMEEYSVQSSLWGARPLRDGSPAGPPDAPGELGRGVIPLHNQAPSQDFSTNPRHRVHAPNSGFPALNRKQTNISTIIT